MTSRDLDGAHVGRGIRMPLQKAWKKKQAWSIAISNETKEGRDRPESQATSGVEEFHWSAME